MFKNIAQNSGNVLKKFWVSQSQKFTPFQPVPRFLLTTTDMHSAPSSFPQANQVLIVGAGLSGLSAADYLIKNGVKDLLILEAAERYGGRVHTVTLGDTICELGAKWINASDRPNSVFGLARQAGLIDRKSFESPEEKFFIMNKDAMDEETVQFASILFHDMIKDTERFLVETAPEDQRTAEAYLKAKMSKILARMTKPDATVTEDIFKTLMKNLSCQLGSDLGYIHVKHLGIIAKDLNQPIYIPSGLDQIFKQLVKNIPTDRLILGKPIENIRWGNLAPNESPYVKCFDGSMYYGKHIICTIPLGVLSVFSDKLFNPNLPGAKLDAIQKLGRGSPGKVYLLYQEPVNKWFIGSLMIEGSQLGVASRESWTAGISEIATPPDSRNVLEVKIGGRYNEIAERIGEDILDQDLTNALRKSMKNNKIPHPKEMVRSFWSTDAKSLCGIPFISMTCKESSIEDLASPLRSKGDSDHPTLLFAGDATSVDGFGTVEAARISGIREAQRVLAALH